MMKYILFFAVLFSSLFCFSQTYHFDYMVRKSIFNAILNDEKTYFSFYGIGNETQLFLDKTNKKMIGVLYDSNTKYRNVFNVDVKDDKFQLSYLYTNDLGNKKFSEINNDIIEIKKLKEFTYLIEVFENTKKKEKRLTITIVLQESNYPYLFFEADYIGMKKIRKLFAEAIGIGNYAIKECAVLYGTNGNKMVTKIEEITPANFFINLPQKLIFRDFDYWKEKSE